MAESTQQALAQLQQDVSTPKGLSSPQDQALLLQLSGGNPGDVAAQREASARQLVTSSLTHMGTMIDPQLATEAIASGASNDVASATADPELASVLSGIPSGSGLPAAPQNGPNSTSAPNIDSFNWANFWKNDNPQQLKDNPQFAALGEVPQMNNAYVQGVMNSDPNSTKKWQHWLADAGMYADSGGKPEAPQKVSISGKWGDADVAALKAYMISLFTPDALWSKDPQRQAQAQTFLSSQGFDAQKFWQDQGRSDPNTQIGIVANWMSAQGNGGKQGDALKRFADNYGANNLPDAYRKVYEGVANPGVWDTVVNTGAAIESMTNPLLIFGRLLPHLSDLPPSGLTLAFKGLNRIDPNFNDQISAAMDATDPRTQKRESIANSLNASDRAALTPALTEISNSSGMLPLEWWDQQKTRALLTASYFLAPASGQGSSINPFDDWRLAGQNMATQKSATALLMDQFLGPGKGDQWIADHPTAAGITDFAINSLDDPLTYLAPETLGRTAAKGAGAIGVRSLLSDSAKATFDRVVDPRLEMEKSMVPQIQAVQQMGGGSRQNLERLLGITDDMMANPTAAARYEPVLQQLLKEQNPTLIRSLLDQHFRHEFHTPRGYLQWQQGVKALTPEVARKMDSGFATRLRAIGSMKDNSLSLTVDRPIEAANSMEEAMHISGMAEKDIIDAINEFRSLTPDKRQFWVDGKLAKLLDESPEGKRIQAATGRTLSQETRDFRDTMMKGTTFRNAADGESLIGPYQRVSEHSYAPKQPEPGKGVANTPDLGQETSKAKVRMDPANERTIAKLDEGMRALQDSFAKHVDGAIDKMRRADPGLAIDAAKAQALADGTIVKLKAEMDKYLAQMQEQAQQLTGGMPTTRGAPMFTSQLRQTLHMPVDNYTLYSYLNPVLHKAEEFQSKYRADAVTTLLKSYMLAQPSTALRVMIGDDLSRFVIQLAMDGHPTVAAKAVLWGGGKGIAASLDTAPRAVLAAVVKASRMAPKTAAKLSDHESHLVKNAIAYLEQSGFRDRMTVAKQIGDADLSEYIPYAPRSPGYAEAFQRGFHMWSNSAELRQWAKNMRLGGESQAHSGLLDTYVNHAKDPALKARLDELVGMHADRADITPALSKVGKVTKKPLTSSKAKAVLDAQTKWATQVHDYMTTAFRHPTITRWLEDGQINNDELAKLYKQNPEVFPVTPSPRLTVGGGNVFASLTERAQSLLRGSFTNVAQPMIEVSRAEGARLLQQQYAKHIAKVYGKEMSPEEVDAISTAKAVSWMRQSLYTGQRTLMGRSLRNIVPFNGATSNMARFYVKIAREHPRLQMPMIRAGVQMEQSAQQPTTDTTGFGGILGKLGFAGGSALQYNPAHAFFFSSDGIASFIPGLSPIFQPLTGWANQNQGIIDEINTIPGLREQFQYTASPGQHPVIPWLQKTLDGLGLLSPLHDPITQGIPFIGSDVNVNKRDLLDKGRQLEADYLSGKRTTEPSASDIASAQGSALLTDATVGGVLPITPRVVDEKAVHITAANKEIADLGAAPTGAQMDAVLAKYPDIAPVLSYFDPRTTLQQRDALASDPKTSWIDPYVNTIYSTPTGTAKPVTLSEFDAAVQTGNEQLLGVGDFIPNVRQYAANEQSWTQYNALKTAEQWYQTSYGVTASDPDYKAWVATNISPIIANMEADNLAWATQFMTMKSKSPAGLQASTQSIRNVMTWEVIPQNSALENDRSVAWRRALVRIQEAGASLNELRSTNSGAAAEQDVLDALNVYLQAYAAQSPAFAADLNHYHWTDFSDVATYISDQMSAANAA